MVCPVMRGPLCVRIPVSQFKDNRFSRELHVNSVNSLDHSGEGVERGREGSSEVEW